MSGPSGTTSGSAGLRRSLNMTEPLSSELLRQYETWECLGDSYPDAWHRESLGPAPREGAPVQDYPRIPAIKDLIRELARHRCLRCGHPYPPGIAEAHPRGEWTPCDEDCRHGGPLRVVEEESEFPQRIYECPAWQDIVGLRSGGLSVIARVEAHWRILTVHHLDEDKANCRWWNLAALCQRCHLRMQRAVVMDRIYSFEHSEWFKPYAAGFYAFKYLGEDLTREETMKRLDELLALEHRFTQEAIF